MHSQLKQYLEDVEQGLKSLPAEQRQNDRNSWHRIVSTMRRADSTMATAVL